MGKSLSVIPWRCGQKKTWPRGLGEGLSLIVNRQRWWLRESPDVPLGAWRDVGEPISPQLRGRLTKLVSGCRISRGRPVLRA
jgi:hypothetical protein